MFRTVLTADIGTSNIKLGVRDAVYTEKTCVAVERGNEFRIAAVGNKAAESRSGTIIHPMREGGAANINLLAILLKRAVQKCTGRKEPAYIELHAALPRVTANIKKYSMKQALRTAGFRNFEFHDSLIMGAVGAGLDMFSHTAVMIADIGGETTAAAILCNGGILFESVGNTGSSAAERGIQNFFLEKHGLLIGAKTAEIIKVNLDKDAFVVDGRSSVTGLPEKVSVSAEEARKAAERGLYNVITVITDAIKATEPEAAADLLDSGIVLIGGGAKQYGLSKRMEALLGLPVRTAENAETAVIEGMRECIFKNRKVYREMIAENAESAAEEQ